MSDTITYADCRHCGTTALKAMPPEEAATADPYICADCYEDGWRMDEDTRYVYREYEPNV